MKRVILLIFMLLVIGSSTFAATKIPQVFLNGIELKFDFESGYPFVDETGRVQVPVRRFAELTQSTVAWDDNSQQVGIKKNNNFLQIPIGKNYYIKDGVTEQLDSKSIIRNSRVYLPLRAISESLGYIVEWNSKSQRASLSFGDASDHIINEGEIPLNHYKVNYFKSDAPNAIVATEIVDFIGVNLSEDFNGISPENFSATWIGNIEFLQDTTKRIDKSLSWASATLTVDDRKVYSDTYTFTKGRHKIQVEYHNNWHTVDFLLQFNDIEQVLQGDVLINKIKSFMDADTQIQYVGVYESVNPQHVIELKPKDTIKPTVLFLNSYDPVNWKITNENNSNIKAVVYNSFNNGARVSFNANNTIPIFKMSNLVWTHTPYPSISEVGHGYTFDNLEFNELRNQMMDLFGKKIEGFTGAYSDSTLSVPEIVMTVERTKSIDDAFAEVARLRNKQPLVPSALFKDNSNKVDMSWGSHFNSEPIPKEKFQAYYFNTDNPIKILGKEIRNRVAISYPWSDFIGIESNDFGAYYVGDFTFSKDTLRNVSVSKSWAFSRVFIDGKLVFDETNDGNQDADFMFTKGTHRIEVEYINDWHTVDLLVEFNNLPVSTFESVQEFVKGLLTKDTKVYVAAIYDASTRDLTSRLKLPNRSESILLVLNSYSPTHWIIDTSGKSTLKGIILSTNTSGSTVEFTGGKACKIIRSENVYADIEYISENSLQYYGTQHQQLIVFLRLFGIDRVDGVSTGEIYEGDYVDKVKIIQ